MDLSGFEPEVSACLVQCEGGVIAIRPQAQIKEKAQYALIFIGYLTDLTSSATLSALFHKQPCLLLQLFYIFLLFLL